jgi:hypothetical protein
MTESHLLTVLIQKIIGNLAWKSRLGHPENGGSTPTIPDFILLVLKVRNDKISMPHYSLILCFF